MHTKRLGFRVFFVAWATLGGVSSARADCMGEPETGRCTGDVLTFCDPTEPGGGRVYTVNCATEVFPAGVSATCAEVNPTYGYDCVVAQGEECRFLDGEQFVYAFCAGGRTSACVADTPDGVHRCSTGAGACTAPEPGSAFRPACSAQVAILQCTEGQPAGLNCAALGGQCTDGACSSLPLGAPCGDRLGCSAAAACDARSQRCVDPTAFCTADSLPPSCAGNVLTRCGEGGLALPTRCADVLAPDAGGACGLPFTCVPLGGPDGGACDSVTVGCTAAGQGAACNAARQVYCGTGLGCVTRGTGGSTEERCATTASCVPGATHAGCAGSVATYCLGTPAYVVAEAAGLDCATFGSTCALVNDVPACVGPVGARCDSAELNPGTLLGCTPGLVCVGATGVSLGTCQVPDAGFAPDASAPTRDGGALDAAVPDAASPTGDGGVPSGSSSSSSASASSGSSGGSAPASGSGSGGSAGNGGNGSSSGGGGGQDGCACGAGTHAGLPQGLGLWAVGWMWARWRQRRAS
jgi:hypothetical protein